MKKGRKQSRKPTDAKPNTLRWKAIREVREYLERQIASATFVVDAFREAVASQLSSALFQGDRVTLDLEYTLDELDVLRDACEPVGNLYRALTKNNTVAARRAVDVMVADETVALVHVEFPITIQLLGYKFVCADCGQPYLEMPEFGECTDSYCGDSIRPLYVKYEKATRRSKKAYGKRTRKFTTTLR